MSGPSQNTSTNTTQPPAAFQNAYQQLLGQAQGVASTPYQPYGGSLQAPLSPDQMGGITAVQNAQGAANPFINSAATYLNAATAPLAPTLGPYASAADAYYNSAGQTNLSGTVAPWQAAAAQNFNVGSQAVSPTQFSAGQVQQYESPYTQDVVNATQAQFNNQNAQTNQGIISGAIGSGAWGGDRSGVAQGIAAGQEALAQAPVIAGLKNQGYSQALGEFNNQQQTGLQAQQASRQLALQGGQGIAGLGGQALSAAQQQALLQQNAGQGIAGVGSQVLGANQANAWLNSQAGAGFANLGNEALNTSLTGANALLGTGGLEQQQAQGSLNIPYQQWLAAQAYPFQSTGWLQNLETNLGSSAGGTGTTTSPGPNALSQIAGLGAGALGIAGATGGFGQGGWLTNLFHARGGALPERNHGGGIIPFPAHRRSGGGIVHANDDWGPEPPQRRASGGYLIPGAYQGSPMVPQLGITGGIPSNIDDYLAGVAGTASHAMPATYVAPGVTISTGAGGGITGQTPGSGADSSTTGGVITEGAHGADTMGTQGGGWGTIDNRNADGTSNIGQNLLDMGKAALTGVGTVMGGVGAVPALGYAVATGNPPSTLGIARTIAQKLDLVSGDDMSAGDVTGMSVDHPGKENPDEGSGMGLGADVGGGAPDGEKGNESYRRGGIVGYDAGGLVSPDWSLLGDDGDISIPAAPQITTPGTFDPMSDRVPINRIMDWAKSLDFSRGVPSRAPGDANMQWPELSEVRGSPAQSAGIAGPVDRPMPPTSDVPTAPPAPLGSDALIGAPGDRGNTGGMGIVPSAPSAPTRTALAPSGNSQLSPMGGASAPQGGGITGDIPLPPPEPPGAPEDTGTTVSTIDAKTSNSRASDIQGVDRHANPWWALAQAGFATAAGRSPHALENIGAGAEKGVSTFISAEHEAQKLGAQVDETRARLADTAAYREGLLAARDKSTDVRAQHWDDQKNLAMIKALHAAGSRSSDAYQPTSMVDADGHPLLYNRTTHNYEPANVTLGMKPGEAARAAQAAARLDQGQQRINLTKDEQAITNAMRADAQDVAGARSIQSEAAVNAKHVSYKDALATAMENNRSLPGRQAHPAPTQAGTAVAPPMAARVVGQVYPTPKGPMTWTANGWLPAQ